MVNLAPLAHLEGLVGGQQVAELADLVRAAPRGGGLCYKMILLW